MRYFISVGTNWDLTLQEKGRGLLWALWRIHSARETGILSVEWDKYKKQIAFRQGEPVAAKSNWLADAFGSFLVREKKLPANELQVLLKAKDASDYKGPIGEWLVSQGKLDPVEMPPLLSKHFRERLFNLLTLTRGKLYFKSIGAETLDVESTRLDEAFQKALWDSSKKMYDEAFCRSKLQSKISRTAKIRAACPLMLPPQDLRLWNDWSQSPKGLQSANAQVLHLLAVADEFDLVVWGESPEEKLQRELKQLEDKFKRAKAHEILGIDENSEVELCRKAYLELVKKYHPDRLSAQDNPDLKKLGERVFAKINEAHSTLTDPEKRKEYEAQLQVEAGGGVEKVHEQLEAEMMLPQAKMALRRRHFKTALELYQKIEKVLKEDAEVLADRVYCQLMTLVESKAPIQDQVNQFRGEINRALKMNGRMADAYYYRGILAKLEGAPEKALQDFDKAMEINPHFNEAASEARVLRMRKDKKASGLFGKKT